MPWKSCNPIEQKLLMLADFLSEEFTITELSVIYEVSRKTIYKWIKRYKANPYNWQKDLSRRPHSHPNQTSEPMINLILKTKQKHLNWGPKKILQFLENKFPDLKLPSHCTAGKWLERNGLVKTKKKRRRVPSYTQPFADCASSNKVWSIDYKGQFKLKNGKYCYPLTISDNYSRYLLCCKALPGTTYKDCRLWLDWTFEKYGLPDVIRSDNGVPFCSASKTGLTRFSVYLIQLGITHERIDKGKPQQNGRHERMHRTLKSEACYPAGKDIYSQQKKFAHFVKEYNEERPHESLDGQTPNSIYCRSKRRFPAKLSKPIYDKPMIKRYIHPNGELSFQKKRYFVSDLLGKKNVGLKKINKGLWEIYYYKMPIALFNEKIKKILPLDKKKM